MSVVVIDFAGDLIPILLTRLAAQGVDPERVFLFDAANTAHVPSFNPFAGTGDVHGRVGNFLSALKREAGSWGVQIEETMRCFSTALAEANYSPLEIEPMFINGPFRASVGALVTDQYTSAFLKRFETLSEEQQRVQASACLNKLVPFVANPRMRRIFGSGDCSTLRRCVDTKGKIVLINLPKSELQDMAGVLGDLLIRQIWATILHRAQLDERSRPQTRLIIDEFQLSGDQLFGSMIAEGRRFGLSLCLAHQSQIQLSSETRALIRNNSAVRLLFAPGPVDSGELASELAPRKATDAYARLMSLEVGQAYFARRGTVAVRIQTPREAQVTVDPNDLESFTAAVLEKSATPVSEIDRLLTERSLAIDCFQDGSQKSEEVIHAKKPWKRG